MTKSRRRTVLAIGIVVFLVVAAFALSMRESLVDRWHLSRVVGESPPAREAAREYLLERRSSELLSSLVDLVRRHADRELDWASGSPSTPELGEPLATLDEIVLAYGAEGLRELTRLLEISPALARYVAWRAGDAGVSDREVVLALAEGALRHRDLKTTGLIAESFHRIANRRRAAATGTDGDADGYPPGVRALPGLSAYAENEKVWFFDVVLPGFGAALSEFGTDEEILEALRGFLIAAEEPNRSSRWVR